MKEIVPGIHTWSWFSEEKGIDFNGHYVCGAGGAVIVDPPPCDDGVLQRMEELGTPRAILITNAHHARKSTDLAARFGIPILINEADASLVIPPLGGTFKDGESLPAGITAIRVPDSKTPGETALYVPAADALILGDALIGKPAGELSLLPAGKIPDPEKAREGLRRFLEIRFETLLLGDGASFPRGGKEALRRFLSHPAVS